MRYRRTRGQASLETGLTLGIFVTVLVSFCWFAIWGTAYESARFISHEAARAGTAVGATSTDAMNAGVTATSRTALQALAPGSINTYNPAPCSGCSQPSWTGQPLGATSCPNVSSPTSGIWICAQALSPGAANSQTQCRIAVTVSGWIQVPIPFFSGLMKYSFSTVENKEGTSSDLNPGTGVSTCS